MSRVKKSLIVLVLIFIATFVTQTSYAKNTNSYQKIEDHSVDGKTATSKGGYSEDNLFKENYMFCSGHGVAVDTNYKPGGVIYAEPYAAYIMNFLGDHGNGLVLSYGGNGDGSGTYSYWQNAWWTYLGQGGGADNNISSEASNYQAFINEIAAGDGVQTEEKNYETEVRNGVTELLEKIETEGTEASSYEDDMQLYEIVLYMESNIGGKSHAGMSEEEISKIITGSAKRAYKKYYTDRGKEARDFEEDYRKYLAYMNEKPERWENTKMKSSGTTLKEEGYETLKYPNDKSITIRFPKIDEDKLKVTLNKSSDYKEVYNEETNRFVIGPMSLSYKDVVIRQDDGSSSSEGSGSESASGKEPAKKGKILGTLYKVDIYTDASISALSADAYTFLNDKGQEIDGLPENGERFYLTVEKQDNMTKIDRMEYDYTYLVCGGQFQFENGTHGGQRLAWVEKAARWYKTIHGEVGFSNKTKPKQYSNYITIYKNVDGLSSKEVKDKFGERKYFTFKVTVGDKTSYEKVEAGQTLKIGPYTWSEDEEPPSYEVEELDPSEDSWEKGSISTSYGTVNGSVASGKLGEKGEVEEEDGKKVKIKTPEIIVSQNNTYKENKHGKIKIIKTLDKVADEDKTYTFEVTVKDENSNNIIGTDEIVIDIKAGEIGPVEKESMEFNWSSEQKAVYTVSEKTTDGKEASVKYNPAPTGYLKDGEIDIYAENHITDLSGKISLTKRSDVDAVEQKVFTMKVNIYNSNEKKEKIKEETVYFVIRKGEKQGYLSDASGNLIAQNGYTAPQPTWYSNTIKWDETEPTPYYEVIEEGSDNQEFDYTPRINGEGELDDSGKTVPVTAINYKKKEATMKIKKSVNVAPDENKIFKFKVTVYESKDEYEKGDSGKTVYVKDNIEVPVAKDSLTGESNEFKVKWPYNVDKPYYKIEETEKAGYDKSNEITPDNGYLTPSQNIEFTAKNDKDVTTGPEVVGNKISIDKKIDKTINAEQTFVFKATVNYPANTRNPDDSDNKGKTYEENITVKVNENGETAVASSNKLFRWYKGEEVPVCTIEELYDKYKGPEGVNYRADIKDKTLKLDADKPATTFDVTNYRVCKNRVKITKNIADNKVSSSKDQTFKFQIHVEGKADGTTDDDYVIVTVKKGEKSGVAYSKYFEWEYNKDGTAPKYTVKEIVSDGSNSDKNVLVDEQMADGTDADNYDKHNVYPNEGSLDGDMDEITVEAKNEDNEVNEHKNKIKIEKEVVGETVNENLEFSFHVKTTGAQNNIDKDVKLTLQAGAKRVESYVLDDSGNPIEFKWTGDTAPKYTIEENNKGADGYVTIKGVSSGKEYKYMSHGPYSGDLSEEQAQVIVKAVNTQVYSNTFVINKETEHEASKNEVFKFHVKVTGANEGNYEQDVEITVKKGEKTATWEGPTFTWNYDKEAPKYEVTEVDAEYNETETEIKYANKKYTPQIPNNGKGTLDGSKVKIEVNAYNAEKDNKKANLTIKKKLSNDTDPELAAKEMYTFNATIKGVKVGDKSNQTINLTKTIKAGEIADFGILEWNDWEANPTFTITEEGGEGIAAVDGATKVDDRTLTGELKADGDGKVEVVVTNNITEHSGRIIVQKNAETQDKGISGNPAFKITVNIKGSFKYKGENKKEVTISKELHSGETWESEDIIWYGDNAPTYTVVESQGTDDMPIGWRYRDTSIVGIGTITTDEGFSIQDGGSTVTINNIFETKVYFDLSFSMGGKVWVDNGKIKDSTIAGDNKYSGSEVDTLKEGVEVTLYNEDGSPAEAYKDANNNKVTWPIITDSKGRWDVPRLELGKSYYVEYKYDGEKYETVEPLVTSNGDVEKFKNAGTGTKGDGTGRDDYANDSMAVQTDNNAEKIETVSGKTEMSSEGKTTGYVNGKDEITYSAEVGSYPVQSTVDKTDGNGNLLETFKATATTDKLGLTFPFYNIDGDSGLAISSEDENISGITVENPDQWGLVDVISDTSSGIATRTYKYMAVYNYCKNVNLGLREKTDADIGLSKTLTRADVIVKENWYQYNYSGRYDLTENPEKLNVQVKSTDSNSTELKDLEELNEKIGYDIGVYRSDYYYRAEVYNNANKGLYDGLVSRNSDVLSNTEMDVYLTYEIKLKNNSAQYKAVVNSIDDYYDNGLELVKADVSKYISRKQVGSNGSAENVDKTQEIVKESDYANDWKVVKTGIASIDKDKNDAYITYDKMTLDHKFELGSGDEEKITMVFKVKKDTDSSYGISNAIVLGQKVNVAEIGSYSLYKGDKQAGKIERDSAPGNVNVSTLNGKGYYEDDTFAAPRINVTLIGDSGDPNPTPTPDPKTPDRTISGTVWEDKRNTNYEGQTIGNGELDSGEQKISGLKTQLVEKIIVNNTEYDFAWPSNEVLIDGYTMQQLTGLTGVNNTDSNGNYTFKNVPSGAYVVRFTYGNKKIESSIEDDLGTKIPYNGQDFKSSRYTATDGIVQADTYLSNDGSSRVNKNSAIDSEARRLEVTAKSREMTYRNSSVLQQYQSSLYTDYYMYADTPKIKLVDNNESAINVENVNFGVEQRPTEKLILDKQIEEIKLTTRDGQNMMDAKYNISYNDNGKLNISLDSANSFGTENLQALNRNNATNQGFRYINVDTDLLQGATITVKYRVTVMNQSETDRTGRLDAIAYSEDGTKINEAIEEITKKLASYSKDGNTYKNDTKQGFYVGTVYYYGADKGLFDYSKEKYTTGSSADNIVKTTVREIIDYVDNDAVFAQKNNNTSNMSWRSITVSELENYVSPSIVDVNHDDDERLTVLDSKQMEYITENKNNLAVNVDDGSKNNELIKALEPKGQGYINLTTSRTIDAEADDLQIDNLAEIIKYNNTVGRRNSIQTLGNEDPAVEIETIVNKETVFKSIPKEPVGDASVTEQITLSPPTGKSILLWRLQLLGTITAGLTIVAGGIVFIKKKVLK